MSEVMNSPAGASRDGAGWRGGVCLVALALAGLTLLAPLTTYHVPGRVGLLLVLTALLEVAHGFRRATADGQRSAWFGGAITLGMALLLINAPYFAATAIVLFLAGWFALDGVRHLVWAAFGLGGQRSVPVCVACGLAYLLAAAALLLWKGQLSVDWTVAIAAAARILGTAWDIALSPVLGTTAAGDVVVSDLALPENAEMQALARDIADEEAGRVVIDRGWILGFIATLFAIHLGRMGYDRTLVGLLSPLLATLGDVAAALLLAFTLVIPTGMLWRRLTRGIERRGWVWILAAADGQRGWLRRAAALLLRHRLRFSVRMARARLSFTAALSRGLQIGLPLAAIIAATVPVWGMSWYFDTENWASGVWNSWAEQRTDTWREAMVKTVADDERKRPLPEAFAVSPPGIEAGADFSFLVIGDTGEGDASQHSLRAHFLDVVRRPEVRFVVVSSDVVYPTGAMRNYEANFWLPFMGTTRPVYAIPGNHDWYDALEGFAATFLEPDAARAMMRTRVEVDNRITTTTDARIEELIATASRLRRFYGVPTQQQRAMFFQFQTDTFALFALDTGVARRLDPAQLAWFRATLAAARGKTKMVILGHPFYAGGYYTAPDGSDFAALHELLREHDVSIIMAGDTHDLEYYTEERSGRSTITHMVNGGGGAYLSFGTALAWPSEAPTAAWAFYPGRAAVIDKVETTTQPWKRPAWWWTKRMGAWPFSAEWLSAAFDVNVAPFYQSFVEVRVEPKQRRIRLLPHGVHGPLRWRDLEASRQARPSGAVSPDAAVEWTVPMAAK